MSSIYTSHEQRAAAKYGIVALWWFEIPQPIDDFVT